MENPSPMHAGPEPPAAERYRIHFAKRGDMRWIGHRDLVRWMERLFRRIGLPLAMSRGFHPKPKIRFASALALGIEGLAEWVEVALTQCVPSAELLDRLRRETQAGIEFHRVETVAGKMPQICRATYEIEPPVAAREALPAAVESVLAATSLPVERHGKPQPVDLRPGIESIRFDGARLRFTIAAGRHGAVRPREILGLLGGEAWETQGAVLQRVELRFVEPVSTSEASDERVPDTPDMITDRLPEESARERSAPLDDRIHPKVLESLNENGP